MTRRAYFLRSILFAFVLLTTILFANTASFAAYQTWPSPLNYGQQANPSSGNYQDPAICSDGKTGSLIAWVSITTHNIYAARVNRTGGKEWSTSYNVGGSYPQNPVIISNGNGGAVIVCGDVSAQKIYALIINNSGTVLYSTSFTATNLAQNSLSVCTDGLGGAYVVWSNPTNAYIQRLRSNGTRSPASPVTAATAGSSGDYTELYGYASVTATGTGEAIVVWPYEYSSGGWGGGYTDYIYALKYDGSCNTLWPVRATLYSVASGNLYYPTACTDGSGGAFAVFSNKTSIIYGAHIQASGSSPSGAGIITATGLYLAPTTGDIIDIKYDNNGSAVICWPADSIYSTSYNSVYVNKFDKNLTVKWTGLAHGGVEMTHGTSHTASHGRVAGVGTGETFAVWQENYPSAYNKIYAQLLDAPGTRIFASPIQLSSIIAPSSTYSDQNPCIVDDGVNGASVAWEDQNSSSYIDIYTQRIYQLYPLVCISSTRGSDISGEGTFQYPYATLQKALWKADPMGALPAAFISVEVGTYTGKGNRDLTWPCSNMSNASNNLYIKDYSLTSLATFDAQRQARFISSFEGVTSGNITFDSIGIQNAVSSSSGGAILSCPGNKYSFLNCTIQNCSAEGSSSSGGFISANGSPFYVYALNSTFTNNRSGYYAGVSEVGNWNALRCSFIKNGSKSGGVCLYGSFIANSCLFYSNEATSTWGCGVSNGSSFNSTNNTFYGNKNFSTYAGVQDWGTWSSTNDVFWNNSSTSAPTVINKVFGSSIAALSITNTLMQPNGYPLTALAWTSGTSNITSEPAFVSTRETDTATFLRPGPGSPCLDSGTMSGLPVLTGVATSDLQIFPRMHGFNLDRGAYEFLGPYVQIIYPNGGEKFFPGSTVNVIFNVGDEFGLTYASDGALNVDFSSDNGATYTNVGSKSYSTIVGPPNTFSFPWTVPQTAGTQNRIRVSASRHTGPYHPGYSETNFDVSDASFTIRSPIIFVSNKNGSDNDSTNDGSQAHPFKTIQHGLNNVPNNGTISIDADVYSGTSNGISGNINLTWPDPAIINNFRLKGSGTGLTTIDGISLYDLTSMFIKGQQFTIEAMTIKNMSSASFGGAIWMKPFAGGSPANIWLNNCAFRNCYGANGGVIYGSNNTKITANSCIFSGNSANAGGVASDGTWEADNCIFLGNHAYVGGAIYCDLTTSWNANNCAFINNYSGIPDPDQMSNVAYEATIGHSVLNMYNCVFMSPGPQLFSQGAYAFTGWLHNCLVPDNTSVSVISNIATSYGNPMYVSTLESDPNFLKLLPGSPCLNTGLAGPGIPTIDYYGSPRPADIPSRGPIEHQRKSGNLYVDNWHGIDSDVYTNPNRGSSSQPFKSIMTALHFISSEGTVFVQNGSYYENPHWPLICTDVQLKAVSSTWEYTVVYGVTTESVFDTDRVLFDNYFYYGSNGRTATIEGITITNGNTPYGGGGVHAGHENVFINRCFIDANTTNASGGGLFSGGGPGYPIYANNCYIRGNHSDSTGGGARTCIANNCIFENNSSGSDGGGFYFSPSPAPITNCIFIGNTAAGNGGGLSGANIAYCTFEGNTAGGDGGGAASFNTDHCDFIGNSAANGGGIADSQNATWCNFYGNTATGNGGGVYNVGSSGWVQNCIIATNEAVNGAGIYNSRVKMSLFVGNKASDSGGAIYFDTTVPSIENCVIADNTATNNGSGIYKGLSTPSVPFYVNACTLSHNDVYNASGNMIMSNCILWNGSYSKAGSGAGNLAEYSDIAGGSFTPGSGAILPAQDPLFVDPTSNNYKLQGASATYPSGSPCIDTGTTVGMPIENIDGTNRIPPFDMGAYEYAPATVHLKTPDPNSSAVTLEAGSQYLITWEVTDQSNLAVTYPVNNIYLSMNGGVTWPLLTTVSSAKSYLWTVPATLTNEARIRIEIAPSTPPPVSADDSNYNIYIKDTTWPVLTIEGVSNVIGKSNNLISWEVTDFIPCKLPVTAEVFIPVPMPGTWSRIVTNGASFDSYSYTPPTGISFNYPNGILRIWAHDLVGNITVEMVYFGLDTKDPTMEVTFPSTSTSKEVAFTLVATDENGIDEVRIKTGATAAWLTYPGGIGLPTMLTLIPSLSGLHTVTFEAYDTARNVTSETFVINLDLPVTPEISDVLVDGYSPAPGQYIGRNPVLTFNIHDYNSNLTSAEVTITVGTNSFKYILYPTSLPGDSTDYPCTINTNISRESGSFRVNIKAYNSTHFEQTYDSPIMSISSVASVTTPPKNIPNPFRPAHGESTTFVYRLSNDTNILFIIYDMTGRAIYQKNFNAGSEGGKGPADNNVVWNGKTDFGTLAPNGPYIYLITHDGKILAKGHFAILD